MTTPELEDLLAAPGGRSPLRRHGDAFVAGDGERYEWEGGVLRMLRDIDPPLARELASQDAGAGDYADPRLLMPRYEHHVARMAVEGLLCGAASAGARILDAGCGIGLLGRLYPDRGLVGLDASMTLLREATTGYRLRVEGSAEALPFRDAAFDVVVALNMLHHVITPANAVREFARVLRRGGLLIAVDPRRVAPIEAAKRLLRRNDRTFAPTHKAFGVREYQELIGGSGAFVIEEQRRLGLVSLIGMGGLDALGLSRRIPRPQAAVDAFRYVDDLLFRAPLVARAGLNLAIRARRA